MQSIYRVVIFLEKFINSSQRLSFLKKKELSVVSPSHGILDELQTKKIMQLSKYNDCMLYKIALKLNVFEGKTFTFNQEEYKRKQELDFNRKLPSRLFVTSFSSLLGAHRD